jgi:APA family basic amino acid/polyamine antiporter
MGLGTATALVVASMVGTGVFTTTGLLVPLIPSAPAIVLCWVVGGLAALCGALSYAELGAALPHNGGEYRFLHRLMHPLVAFLSAWVSLIVGFAAPLAALSLGFGSYFAVFVPGTPPWLSGSVLLLVLSVLHVWRVSVGSRVQNLLTAGKVALIVGFVAAGLARGSFALLAEQPKPWLGAVASPGFAVGLLLVSFAYTGWNAAAYVAGEVERPTHVLPRALLGGTGLVLVLYLALNVVFLAAAPLGELSGKVAVAHVAAERLLGPLGGKLLAAVVTVGLVSTVGAIIVTGPRVYEAVGHDVPRLGWLRRRSADGGPTLAIGLQTGLALAMMATAGFEALLTYVGFTIAAFSAVSVSCVFLLRRRRDIALPFRMPGYPITPLLYVGLMAWMVVDGVRERPIAAAAGAVTVLGGLVAYVAARGKDDRVAPP